MKKVIFILLLSCTVQISEAQNTTKPESIRLFGKKIVKTLASPYYFGRGYLKNGIHKAADFVAEKYISYGLIPVKGQSGYFQNFTFSINKIKQLDVSYINKKGIKTTLRKGVDYIPSAGLPSIDNSFSLLFIDSNTFEHRNGFKKIKQQIDKNSIIVLDERGIKKKSNIKKFKSIKENKYNAAGLIEIKKKLTWTASQTQDDIIKFNFLPGKLPKTTKTITIKSKSELAKDYPIANIIGMVKGKSKPDSFVVFSAHYDHLGGIGDSVYFPGANDNASGTAMLLALARYYAKPKNQPDYSIIFMAFAAEEAGLVGSHYYVQHPTVDLKKIKFLINMDMVGTGIDGITVVDATVYPKEFNKLRQINKRLDLLKTIKKRGEAANSDHYFFYKAGVPSIFIYTLGGTAYHDVYDRSETTPFTAFPNLFTLLTTFVGEL